MIDEINYHRSAESKRKVIEKIEYLNKAAQDLPSTNPVK